MTELVAWISEELVEDRGIRREAWALKINDLFKMVEGLTDEQLDDLRCVKLVAVPGQALKMRPDMGGPSES